MKCLAYIKGLTTSLQKRAKDICLAYNEVSAVETALQEVRESVVRCGHSTSSESQCMSSRAAQEMYASSSKG